MITISVKHGEQELADALRLIMPQATILWSEDSKVELLFTKPSFNQEFWIAVYRDSESIPAKIVRIAERYGFKLKRYPKDGEHDEPELRGKGFQSGLGYVKRIVTDYEDFGEEIIRDVFAIAHGRGLTNQTLTEEIWASFVTDVVARPAV